MHLTAAGDHEYYIGNIMYSLLWRLMQEMNA